MRIPVKDVALRATFGDGDKVIVASIVKEPAWPDDAPVQAIRITVPTDLVSRTVSLNIYVGEAFIFRIYQVTR